MTKGGLLFAFEHSLFTILLSPRNLIISYTSVKYNPLLNNNEYKVFSIYKSSGSTSQ